MDYLQRKRPEIYDYIIDNYEEKDWNNEACSYLVETVIDDYSIDDFLSSEFGGEEEIAKFATELQEYLKYGKEGKSKKKKVINFDEWEPENKKFKPRSFVTIFQTGLQPVE